MASATNQDQLNDITYESGVNPDGTIANPSFAAWQNNTPATYSSTMGFAHKWYNDASGHTIADTTTAGTPGGTVTYSFGSNVTADQQAAFVSDLTLWSDIANIKFTQAAAGTTSDLLFNVTSSGSTNNASTPQGYSVAGSTALPAELDPTQMRMVNGQQQTVGAQDVVTFNNSGGYGTIGSFSDQGGYGEDSLTHELGHMMGLGHTGPYNDGAQGSNQDASQYNAFDTRQYSVMSYIQPEDPNATYYSQYSGQGTNYTQVTSTTVTTPTGTMTTTTTTPVAPETPMIDDILAVQRLYGASSTGALTQAQTFGFNCTVNDAAKPFFDFTQNVNPVITLYDTSTTGSTLDCSQFSTNSNINLNPGTFSTANAGTLTNNIAIAYGTKIDTAIGGSGNDTFTVNADNDTIDGGTGTNKAVFSGARADYTVAMSPDTSNIVVTNNATGVSDTLRNIQSLQFSDETDPVMCFASGTLIRTVRGDVPVEALAAGDLAVTASGSLRPIRWLGHRTIERPDFEQQPVRIAAGAFGAGLPERELRLSPGHPVLVGADEDGQGGHLVPVMCLINGTTVARVPVDAVTYWHVELDVHDILLAEGLPAESFLDWGCRGWFGADAAAHALLDPDFVVPGLGNRCRPVAVDGPVVEAERRRLDALFATSLVAHCAWPSEEAGAFAF